MMMMMVPWRWLTVLYCKPLELYDIYAWTRRTTTTTKTGTTEASPSSNSSSLVLSSLGRTGWTTASDELQQNSRPRPASAVLASEHTMDERRTDGQRDGRASPAFALAAGHSKQRS
jgi:hypothetical protein